MPDEDIVLLREMLEKAHVCRQFVEGRSRSDLDDDLLLYYAVAKAVELIGEAAWHVTDSTRAQNPEIDWNGIIGMRHRLVHGFQKINRNYSMDGSATWSACPHHPTSNGPVATRRLTCAPRQPAFVYALNHLLTQHIIPASPDIHPTESRASIHTGPASCPLGYLPTANRRRGSAG